VRFLGSKPPLGFYVLSYSNRAVRSRLSNRTVTFNRHSIAVALFMRRKESKVGEKEKKDCKS